MPLPTPSEEAWRYSRIDQLDLDRYRPGGAGGEGTFLGPTVARAATVRVLNGAVVGIDLDPGWAAKGLVVADIATLPEAPEALGRCADGSPDAFTVMNDAFGAGGTLISVPDGMVVEDPIVVEHWIAGAGGASFPRTVVAMGEDSEAHVLERFTSGGDAHLVVPVTELSVGDAARLRFVGMQDHGPEIWQIALVRAAVGRDATLRASAVALGGDYARLRSEALLTGSGASSEMVAVYFANEHQMLDFRTLQDHDAPHTTSELLFKGAVEDEAESVYSGLVRLRPDAARANATQTNRNLVLSEGASAKSIPNLEIECDDVRCSHASAVGPIDADQLYYLATRGVPPDVAERLIVFGFFEDAIDRLAFGSGTERLRAAVTRKFDARRCCHPDEVAPAGNRGQENPPNA
ncbi:MAG TPA: Fe-S cluster assembly protein SufD [Acidimicrobiia bacterium]|nr:Fe-S cluster assembly protein SufD [Acidimicrobiia bacterium]